MRDVDDKPLDTRAGRMEIPRSRGAASGFLLVLLGLWGALIPFIGPYFDFAYDPDTPWTWTPARGWLEVLPGVVTVLGGLLLLMSRNRATAMFGGWITVIAGAWFVVGRLFAAPWGLGDFGAPVADTLAAQMALELTFFTGLGALIIFLGGMALGRLSVRSLRDIRYAQRPLAAVPAAQDPVGAPAATSHRVPSEAATTPAAPLGDRPAQSVDERPRRGWRAIFRGTRRRDRDRTPVSH
ncbi:MAG: hypothetical protein KDB72_20015 [Mycobacterium sp.]|nr:hypothetical protein [Mycobacterium sp.]